MQVARTTAPCDTQTWQHALERALSAHGGTSALAHYPHIAFAFPADDTNIHTGEYPLVDYRELKKWALSRGWRVLPAPERAHHGKRYTPPIRFTRLLGSYH